MPGAPKVVLLMLFKALLDSSLPGVQMPPFGMIWLHFWLPDGWEPVWLPFAVFRILVWRLNLSSRRPLAVSFGSLERLLYIKL
jgi:hypothetical protein